MNNNRIRTKEKILILLVIAFELFVFTPYLQWQLSKIIVASVFFAILVFLFSSEISIFHEESSVFLIAIIQSLQFLAYWLLGISTCSFNKLVYHIIIVWLFYALVKLQGLNLKAKCFVAYFAIVIILFNVIDNIRINIIYPNASEDINFSWGEKYYSMNTGNSVFIALSSFFALFAMYQFTSNRTIKKKFFWLFLTVISTVYILITGRGISFFTLFVGIILILYVRLVSLLTSRAQRIMFVMFSIAIAAVAIFLILPNFLIFLSEIVDERLGYRIREIAYLLNFKNYNSSSGGGIVSGYSRLMLYKMSLSTWCDSLKNFIFGIGEHASFVDSLNKIGIGAHSAIFDTFAEYGIIGGFFLLLLLVKTYHFIYKDMDGAARVIFYSFFVNAMLNNVIELNCLLFIYVIIPFFSCIKQNK